MTSTIEINIDPDEVFNRLHQTEKEEFVDSNIDWATDDKILSEVISRNLCHEVIDRMSDKDLLDSIENRLAGILER